MAIRDLFAAIAGIFRRPEPTPLERAITEADEIMARAEKESPVPAGESGFQVPVIETKFDAQGRITADTANFAGLIRMLNSGAEELVAALEQASRDRSSHNLYAAAFEIYRIVKPYQIHFISGGEDLWLDSARKMKALAEEAAAMDGAAPEACNLAGVIAGTPWGFRGFSLNSVQTGKDGMDESQDISDQIKKDEIIAADISQALAWFEKGAALGDEVCADNAVKAREALRQNRPETPPSGPWEKPGPQ